MRNEQEPSEPSSKFVSFISPLTFLSSLASSRDGVERTTLQDSFSVVSTTSLVNIFGMEVESGKHILEPG